MQSSVDMEKILRPLQGQLVTVTEMDTDRYGRTVGLVSLDGASVNVNTVAQGHAWFYPQYCKQEPVCGRIKAAEAEARQKKVGLWATDTPVEPWKWRQK
jgi:endonuclease YncB( thermonuclease family)